MDPATPKVAIEKLKGKHILLVEDHHDLAEMLTKLLADHDVRVSDVNSGNKALSEIEKERPDLILLDLNLPDMNGLGVVTRVRQNDKTKFLPILVVTASPYEKQNCLRAGCSDFIQKPFHPSDLLNRIAMLVD
jgi:DNA-binding response OmpR family regulator